MNWQASFGCLALAAILLGCGPDFRTICEEQEGCLKGNDADIDACVIAFEGIRDNAYDIGCGEEYDALVSCYIPQYECLTGGMCMNNSDCGGAGACISGECKSFGVDAANADACEAEANAHQRCD